uniref:Terminal uridylyl transferase 4 n=1 Tax=Zonotrichia albicollis TaxID=44394 RepID=A0A8D2M7C4_ZONAL
MEEAKSSKNGNHDPRKSVRLVCEEGKTVKVTINQNYKYNRNDKSVKDVGRSSPSGNSSRKSKQNDVCSEKQGENKSCKVNSCIPGTKDLGSSVQDRSHGKGKKFSNLSSAMENLKQPKSQPVGENAPGSHVSGNGVSMESLTAPQKGKLVLENPVGVHTLKTGVDQAGDPERSGEKWARKVSIIRKIKNSESTKEHALEADYLENTGVIDESNLTVEQQLGLKQAEERLERDYISRLEKRSPEYTNCQYLCKLCLVHIENIQGAHKHIKEKRHKKNIMEKQEENELRALPPPSPAQLAALSFTLIQAANEQGISDEDFRVRQEIVNEMEKIIQQPLPDCSLRMYGSCLTRFAFKTSDVNIDIKFPPKMSQPDVLIQVLEILKNRCDVPPHSDNPLSVLHCACSGLTCKVSARNDVACLTTDLLAALGKLEPVLIPLVLAFRYWARLCHIDCQAEGGIPSYSFALMVIFFLQQRKPRILPSYLGNWIEGFDSKRPDDHQLKGVEDEEFVRWEYKPPTNGAAKNSVGAESKAKVEQQKGGGKKATSSEVDNQSNAKEKHGISLLAFKTPHQVSLGQLWLELLKFYTLEFALEEYVISIRVQELLTRENKNWPKRRIAIEDPFALKRNVARSLNSQMVFEYILERFRTAYKYFACPQSKDGIKSKPDTKKKEKGKMNNKKSTRSEEPVANCCLPQGENVVDKEVTESGCDIAENEVECNTVVEAVAKRCTSQNMDPLLLSTLDSSYDEDKEEALPLISNECCELKEKSPKERDDLEISVCLTEEELSHHCNCSAHQPDDTNSSNEFSDAESRQSLVLESSPKCTGTPATSASCKAVLETQDLKEEGRLSTEEMHYVFDKFIFTSGKPPTIVCSICKRDGHSKNDCPEDFKKIDLKPLPPMTDRFREILDIVCKRCFDELSPPLSEQQNREQILASLERFIRKEYNDKARLCLFGSSKNGFGFRDSDLDICMTLEGHENAEKLNCKEIIEGLAKVLKKHPGLRNILPITTAKVPIVKFEHRRSGLEGDISLYNTLAQHNTRMLATYAAIDPRVQYLGYTMKVFAKRCDIGDASRGSLSSYAYILMVLYFLQQRNPPVIPVLQEVGSENEVMKIDALFLQKKRLPSLGKNTESLGELWLGLLRFYTEEFDFKEYVISIRQKKLLTTFEKQWTSKCIAIEDPFDLNHNLGAGVSRKMTNFIMKAFINGRKLFGTPFYPAVGREAEYFFDSKVLTDGELAPNDRCCRVCGKIGHYMKDCPKRRRLNHEGFFCPNTVRQLLDKPGELLTSLDDRETREKRCFICGDVGHVRRDCPEFKQTRQRNNSVPGTQLVRSMVNSQLVAVGQQQVERPLRTRQSSECVSSSYSPQPQQFPQNSSQPASINQTQPQSISQSKHVPQPQQGAQPAHQVQLPLFNFPQSPPGQYSTLHNLGLLQMHHHHQIQLPNTSWPIHGPVIHSAPGNPPHSTNSSVSLNDPSIIFAQPAARPMGIPSTSHEGHWHNPVTPNSLVNNGTVGNSGQFGKMNPPSVPWDHGTPTHFPLLRGAWPYNMPQNYMQQGNASYPPNKPFYPQGTRTTLEWCCPKLPTGNQPTTSHSVGFEEIQQH